jgi:hypothetical protein
MQLTPYRTLFDSASPDSTSGCGSRSMRGRMSDELAYPHAYTRPCERAAVRAHRINQQYLLVLKNRGTDAEQAAVGAHAAISNQQLVGRGSAYRSPISATHPRAHLVALVQLDDLLDTRKALADDLPRCVAQNTPPSIIRSDFAPTPTRGARHLCA